MSPVTKTMANNHHGIESTAFLLSKFGEGRGIDSISSSTTVDLWTTSFISVGSLLSASSTPLTTSPTVRTVESGLSAAHPNSKDAMMTERNIFIT